MAIICDRARAVYYPVPKVACTSLKAFFWEINTGKSWSARPAFIHRLRRKLGFGRARGKTLHSVSDYRTLDFDAQDPVPEGYSRVAVVRDPLMRLHSAWSNKANRRVFRQHGEVSILQASGLNDSPTFAQFIEQYDEYRRLSFPVQRHTGPLVQYLGNDLRWFTHVYRIEQLGQLETWIQERVGSPVKIPSLNRRESERRSDHLDSTHIDKVVDILSGDYRLLRDYYDLEASLKRFWRPDAA